LFVRRVVDQLQVKRVLTILYSKLGDVEMLFLNEVLPETSKAFGQMQNSIFKDGFLDLKTKELIAVASSVLMRCQFCVDAHSQRAVAAGATKEDIVEAISVAMFIDAGSQIGWTKVYGENMYDRIFEKDKEEEDCSCCCGD
jgi:AhpD family alkylhydroperoxidase